MDRKRLKAALRSAGTLLLIVGWLLLLAGMWFFASPAAHGLAAGRPDDTGTDGGALVTEAGKGAD